MVVAMSESVKLVAFFKVVPMQAFQAGASETELMGHHFGSPRVCQDDTIFIISDNSPAREVVVFCFRRLGSNDPTGDSMVWAPMLRFTA
ncbi:hypothetical protein CORC01_08739 [Colletotrichum orchidophilum]|uniref:Uncharacterized protein n=1 Tax=Colletotrichum orchidophilum TaxID=1209926 RepID=A0A1G4B3B5_9PEZI|nr:uncharacterized protein CORC01_08739 [Colletotrichum orchidophilum]OHE95887.1 hypothetical protein CORC01_08739 [Colletotrichum orchidophilum]